MVRVVEAPGFHPEEAPVSWGWDPQLWKERQKEDGDLVAVRACLEQGVPLGAAEKRTQTWVVKKLLGQWERLCLKDGVVCRSVQDLTAVLQVVVPEGQVEPLLRAYHVQLGHQGKERKVSLLRRCFYWSGMEASVNLFVQGCPRCMLFKARREVRAPLVSLCPRAPLHIVAMDYVHKSCILIKGRILSLRLCGNCASSMGVRRPTPLHTILKVTEGVNGLIRPC